MADALSNLSRQLGDRYQIERELGRGGMGTVYLARDKRLDRPVALKVLPDEYAAEPDLRERFLRETRLAAGFSHPNIVPVFAIEESDAVLAFAMGFVEGESLSVRVARDGPLGRRDAVRLLQDVSYALAYAHGRGVVHRDIKPDNIMIERATGRALVMDFGIARAITPVADTRGLTRVGEVVGTPEYMSPEQAVGDPVDGRADLYSLGLVAWFALAGRTAVTGESTQRILVKQLTEKIPPLASVRSDLPATLCDVVDRCCEKEAEDRFPTAEAVVEALDAAQLATPDVPVAVRLVTPDLAAMSQRALLAAVLLVYGAVHIATTGKGNVLAIGLIVLATAWVGGMAALTELRRLRHIGYSVDELQRQMRVIQAERDEVRSARAIDGALVRRRRRRVIAASVILMSMLGVLYGLLQGKVKHGDANLTGTLELVTFFGGLLASALALTVLLSSPFRRPLSETLFRAVWLGAIGRWVLRLLGRSPLPVSSGNGALGRITSAASPAGSASPSAGVSAAAPMSHGATAMADGVTLNGVATDLHALRVRVDALESRMN